MLFQISIEIYFYLLQIRRQLDKQQNCHVVFFLITIFCLFTNRSIYYKRKAEFRVSKTSTLSANQNSQINQNKESPIFMQKNKFEKNFLNLNEIDKFQKTAKNEEIVIMNHLTVNLHLIMLSYVFLLPGILYGWNVPAKQRILAFLVVLQKTGMRF